MIMVRNSVARKLRAAGTSSAVPPSPNNKALWHSNSTHCRSVGNVGHKSMAALASISAQERDISVYNRSSPHVKMGSMHHRRVVKTNRVSQVIVTPPPTPPLLLEGDEMFISQSGISHTVYQLKDGSKNNGVNHNSCRDVVLEESYDIERAIKKITLLGPPALLNDDHSCGEGTGDSKSNSDSQLEDIFSFDLQEINHGVQNGSGTGSMSWDSSIVMGLYFAVNPDELRGNVLELGSGVGLGGILSNAATNMIHGDTSDSSTRRVTHTDVNEDVLKMLQINMDAAAKSNGFARDNICIQKLDWYEFLGDSQTTSTNDASLQDADRYDTIIASDCAYLHSQIAPLSETISKLLGNKRGGETLHMFAPYNRAVVHELLEELHHKKEMHVHVEDIEMSKYRIRQGGGIRGKGQFWNDGPKEALRDMTCGASKFLHITAWHKTGLEIAEETHRVQYQITDID